MPATTKTTTKKTTTKGTPEKIGLVLFTKVKRDVVDAALEKLEIKPKGSTAARVKQLNAKFLELNESEDLYVCEVKDGGCGGEFTEAFELCPFCGKADEDEGTNGKSTKLAKPIEALPKTLTKFSDKDLDSDVKDIIALKHQTAMSMWDLGVAIKQNHDRDFWKLRRGEDGGPKYRNVKQFWAEELGFSHTYCYSLMDIAANFKKEDVKKVGTSKLALILRAPEKKRAGLLKSARGGARKSEIAAAVREANANSNGAAAEGGKETKRRLMVAVMPGRKTIKLWAKPKSKDAEPKRAKRMGDLPHGEILFENNTRMTFKLADKDGEYVLICEADRL